MTKKRQLTKPELYRLVAEQVGLTPYRTRLTLEAAFEEISTAIFASGRFEWSGFGVFWLRKRKGREVPMPFLDGAVGKIPPGVDVAFRPAKKLKARERSRRA